MISKKMQNAINDQITLEFYSANLYLAMSAHMETKNLKGFAHWLRVQYEEETFHALKFYDYVNSREGVVVIQNIDAPPTDFGTPAKIFKHVLEHEQEITSSINKLYKVAVEQNDVATQIFLHWYINEQIEEESNASEVLGKLTLIGERGVDLLYLDTELAKRVFVPPSASNEAQA